MYEYVIIEAFDVLSVVSRAMVGIKEPQFLTDQPSTRLIPITSASASTLLEPYHVDLLPEYGYVSREYLMSGYATGNSYCTRLLLRCPADQANFSGFVVVEPSHLWGGTSIWRAVNRWLMRNGDHIHTRTNGNTSSSLFVQVMLGWKSTLKRPRP